MLSSKVLLQNPSTWRRPLTCILRRAPTLCWLRAPGRPLSTRAAVIGSGPAGFYSASELLRIPEIECVHMFERLPCPFGLVRGGVAPDHDSDKLVCNQFDVTARSDRFKFYGNVSIGDTATGVSIDELRSHYDVVVLAYGAQQDRTLDVPGEELNGVHSARLFVGWYHGSPGFTEHQFNLEGRTAVIIGNGNVALDVARMLVKPRELLAPTEISDHALRALKRSNVRDVHIVGRRGVAQAAFTNRELRELTKLPNCAVHIDADALRLGKACQEEVDGDRARKRQLKLWKEVAARDADAAHSTDSEYNVYFHFLLSPLRFEASPTDASSVGAVVLGRNRLVGYSGAQRVQRDETAPDVRLDNVGIVFKSIGYKSVAMPGVPFDEKTATVPNSGGAVLDRRDGEVVDGLYVCGWLKRGPSGIIGTNKFDAEETVATVVEHMRSGRVGGVPRTDAARGAIDQLLRDRDVRVVTYADWQRIDAAEVANGRAEGKVRKKFTSVREMLDVLR